ncbi:MAG TPA: Xaa-Pro peptidase family protein [Verrucomicrobiae bacterium]|nr:Xaa-Pro peptidase family protein [Verrucomicrobiae bacterium]
MMEKVSNLEITARIGKLQELMRKQEIEGALLLQRADLIYFSGTGQNAHLFVPAEGEPVLLVRKSLVRASEESPLQTIVQLNSFKDLIQYLVDVKVLGMELDVLPVNLFERYRALAPASKIVDVSGLIKQIRIVKSPFELAQLRQAAVTLNAAVESLPQILRPGISEVALAGEMEAVARAGGSQGYIRMRSFNQEMNFAHIFSGPNAAYPSFFDGPTGGLGLGAAFPQGPSLDSIVPGTPIVMDICVGYNGYIVDQTRIASLGPIDPFFRDVYAKSLKIQEFLINAARPGVVAGDLYEIALQQVTEMGLREHFMGYVPDQAPFVGHGVGLELDELPVLAKGVKTVLEPGMVFAAEPKFIFPGKGVAGIENTFVVTETGLERITFSTEEIIEVG